MVSPSYSEVSIHFIALNLGYVRINNKNSLLFNLLPVSGCSLVPASRGIFPKVGWISH